jgi:hypothetical protein
MAAGVALASRVCRGFAGLLAAIVGQSNVFLLSFMQVKRAVAETGARRPDRPASRGDQTGRRIARKCVFFKIIVNSAKHFRPQGRDADAQCRRWMLRLAADV